MLNKGLMDETPLCPLIVRTNIYFPQATWTKLKDNLYLQMRSLLKLHKPLQVYHTKHVVIPHLAAYWWIFCIY